MKLNVSYLLNYLPSSDTFQRQSGGWFDIPWSGCHGKQVKDRDNTDHWTTQRCKHQNYHGHRYEQFVLYNVFVIFFSCFFFLKQTGYTLIHSGTIEKTKRWTNKNDLHSELVLIAWNNYIRNLIAVLNGKCVVFKVYRSWF